MSSFYDTWADRYDWSPSFTAAVPFYVGLARDADGPLVELAVGTGRVEITVAQATGRRVTGIDSSRASSRRLARAQLRRESSSTCVKETYGSLKSRSRRP